MFLELGDKTHPGKEGFSFFILLCVLFCNWYICLRYSKKLLRFGFFQSAYPDKVLTYKATEIMGDVQMAK